MSIGKLRKRIGIYKIEQAAPDGIGGFDTNRVLDATIWAEVIELTGSRLETTATVDNLNPLQIKFRNDSYDLSPNNLINYEGMDITIHSITKDPVKWFTTVIGWRSE